MFIHTCLIIFWTICNRNPTYWPFHKVYINTLQNWAFNSINKGKHPSVFPKYGSCFFNKSSAFDPAVRVASIPRRRDGQDVHMHRRSEKEQGNFNTLKKRCQDFLQPRCAPKSVVSGLFQKYCACDAASGQNSWFFRMAVHSFPHPEAPCIKATKTLKFWLSNLVTNYHAKALTN